MLKLRQLHAAGLLARGFTHVHIAKECQIGRATLYRWKAKPEFQAEFARCRQEAEEVFACYRTAVLQAATDQFAADAKAAP
jgi:hypothetical protein